MTSCSSPNISTVYSCWILVCCISLTWHHFNTQTHNWFSAVLDSWFAWYLCCFLFLYYLVNLVLFLVPSCLRFIPRCVFLFYSCHSCSSHLVISCFLCLVLVVVSFFCESVSSHCCLPLSYFCHVPMCGSSRCLVSMVVWVTSCFTWLDPCTFSFTSPVSFVRFCSAVFSTCCLFLCYLVCVYIISISFCSLS